MKRSLIMLYILAFPLPTLAAGNTPLATGLGMTSCDQFTKSIQSSPTMEDTYFEWAQGYMTGMNSMLGFTKAPPKDLTAMTFSTQKNVIRDFCKSHPRMEYEAAVPAVYVLLPAIKMQQ
jgi:hypothetical protein